MLTQGQSSSSKKKRRIGGRCQLRANIPQEKKTQKISEKLDYDKGTELNFSHEFV